MSSYRTSILLLIVLLNLAACKVWYKPGAGEEEQRADQQQCEDETQTSDGQLFIECMQRLGWRYNHMPAPGGDSENVSSAAPVTVPGDQTTPATVTETQINHPQSQSTAKSHDVADRPAQQQPTSWYHDGRDAGQLDDAKSECDETGTDGATFTRCMADKGWHPVSIRISVEQPDDLD